MKLITILTHCALLFFTFISVGHSERYFLCGPDEDGCYRGIYQYCACIPVNEEESNQHYCFNFDKLACTPLSQTPHCDPGLIFKNQASCLAVIFQSGPIPPCTIRSKSFCLAHNTPICNKTGEPHSCQ